MTLKDVKNQIDKISNDLEQTIKEYNGVHQKIRKRGMAIQKLLDGHRLAPEIGQKIQTVLTSIDDSKLLVRQQISKLERYKIDNLGGM